MIFCFSCILNFLYKKFYNLAYKNDIFLAPRHLIRIWRITAAPLNWSNSNCLIFNGIFCLFGQRSPTRSRCSNTLRCTGRKICNTACPWRLLNLRNATRRQAHKANRNCIRIAGACIHKTPHVQTLPDPPEEQLNLPSVRLAFIDAVHAAPVSPGERAKLAKLHRGHGSQAACSSAAAAQHISRHALHTTPVEQARICGIARHLFLHGDVDADPLKAACPEPSDWPGQPVPSPAKSARKPSRRWLCAIGKAKTEQWVAMTKVRIPQKYW